MHVLITCKYQRIELKTIKKEWRHRFIPLQVYRVIIRCPRADNPRVIGPIWPKFEIFLDIMHVLVNYNMNSKLIGSITIEKKWRLQFLRRSRAAYTVVFGLILSNFECVYMTNYMHKNKFCNILHCRKIGQGQHRVIIYIDFVELEYIYNAPCQFHDHRTSESFC